MEILLSITYVVLFLWLLQKVSFFAIEGISIRWLQGVFVLKVLAGIALWWIYTFYYTDRSKADIYKYFDDSLVLFNALRTEPMDYFKMMLGIGIEPDFAEKYFNQMNNWYRQYSANMMNDNRTIIRYNGFLRLFSLGYYQVHSVFTCFLSLLGLMALYKTFLPFLSDKKKELFVVIFLLPSVVFWSSGVMKEGLIFFGLGFLLLSLRKTLEGKFSLIYLLVFSFSLLLMLVLKLYILFALVPVLVGIIISYRIRKPFLVFGFTFISYMIFIGTVHFWIPTFNPMQVIATKQENFINSGKGMIFLKQNEELIALEHTFKDSLIKQIDSNFFSVKKGTPIMRYIRSGEVNQKFPGFIEDEKLVYEVNAWYDRSNSYFEIKKLEATASSFILAMPEALWNTVLRPFPNELNSPLVLMPAFENIFVLIFILLCLYFRKKKLENMNWAWLAFFFTLLLFLIIGLTTPVTGALVRYKVPALPFLLTFFLFLYDKEKLLIRFPKLKKYL